MRSRPVGHAIALRFCACRDDMLSHCIAANESGDAVRSYSSDSKMRRSSVVRVAPRGSALAFPSYTQEGDMQSRGVILNKGVPILWSHRCQDDMRDRRVVPHSGAAVPLSYNCKDDT